MAHGRSWYMVNRTGFRYEFKMSRLLLANGFCLLTIARFIIIISIRRCRTPCIAAFIFSAKNIENSHITSHIWCLLVKWLLKFSIKTREKIEGSLILITQLCVARLFFIHENQTAVYFGFSFAKYYIKPKIGHQKMQQAFFTRASLAEIQSWTNICGLNFV